MILINGSPNVGDDLTAISDQISTVDGIVDAIKLSTDNLPADPADQSLLMAELEVIETHFHSNECWFGDAAAPNAGVHEADEDSLTAFQIDSGNNDWGTAVLILGTGDTPCEAAKTHFDLNQFLITATERTGLHYIRFTWGESEAAGITAEHSTTVPFFVTATLRNASVDIQGKRIPAGTKVWANVKCASDTGTVNFVFGIHEYDA